MLMKKIICLAGFGLALCGSSVYGQCSHEPTVTPSNLILCPNESDTLWTQVYDAYQWYKNGSPIPGATNQYLVVDHYNDSGYDFSVEATLNGCPEMSPTVLVDGWAFLPPFAMIEGNYSIDPSNGDVHACPGDTVLLILGSPYTTNIQWTDNGNPVTNGNNDTLIVLSGGTYGASGSPAVCPNYVEQLGVPINVFFSQVPVPVIAMPGSALEATPATGYSYQWYLDGNIIQGATSATYTPTADGDYTVEITDNYGCSNMSQPYTLNTSSVEESFASSVKIYPNPVSEVLLIEMKGNNILVEVYNTLGQVVMSEQVSGKAALNVKALPAGVYSVRTTGTTAGSKAAFTIIKQ